jgi:hypothetical protein
MGSFDSHSPDTLDDEQIERLAVIVVEDFGLALGRIQFHEIVLMMFENIAGFELMTQQQQHSHVRSMWVAYRRLVAVTRSH